MDPQHLSELWPSSSVLTPSTIHKATWRPMEPCRAAQRHTSRSDMAEPWHPSHANPRLSTPSHTEPRHPSRCCSPAHTEPHRSNPSRTSQHVPRSRSSSHSRHPSRSSSRSKHRHHHSSSRDSPSRHSRSCSHLRSCSPIAGHDDYPSYPEKVAQVRLLFADSPAMLAHPPNPTPARDTNSASRQSTTPPRPHDLPRNPSTAEI